MRLFLAIDLPAKTKREIDKVLKDFKNEYKSFKWVDPGNYHITVHFFGEIGDVEKLKEKIRMALFERRSFYLYFSAVNLFVNEKITIYLAFRREKEAEKLAQKIDDIVNLGKKRDKKFVLHLTLARCKLPSKQQYFVLKKRLEKIDLDINFSIKQIILFESILNGDKPIYRKVAKFDLLHYS